MKASTDKFANKFYGAVTESAANTLTFTEIQTNVDIFAKRAWILHRLEWYAPPATLDMLLAAADALTFALTSSNKLTTLGLDAAGVIDYGEISPFVATYVAASLQYKPFIRDFGNLPGGGLIIAPRPLYVAAKGVSVAAASTWQCRGYFTQLEMSADEYLELVDFYRIVQ